VPDVADRDRSRERQDRAIDNQLLNRGICDGCNR
jgi:hypothetical protein